MLEMKFYLLILGMLQHDLSRIGIQLPNYKEHKFGNLYHALRGLSHSVLETDWLGRQETRSIHPRDNYPYSKDDMHGRTQYLPKS